MRHSYKVSIVRASCEDCEWSSVAKNAMPVAKKHAENYHHNTVVEENVGIVYYGREK